MKSLLKLTKTLLIMAAVFVFSPAKAQTGFAPIYMPPLVDHGSKYIDYMNQQWQIQKQSMNKQGWHFNSDFWSNKYYSYTMLMKDGTKKTVESSIYADSITHRLYLLAGKLDINGDTSSTSKIYASETVMMSRANYYGKLVIGNATDSCWQFKVLEGKINAYSYLSEFDLIGTDDLIAFQFRDGPITDFTPGALELIIKPDEKAYKAFKEKDYYKAIEIYNRHNR